MNNIPLVDLYAQYEEIKDELNNLWKSIIESMYLYLGPNVKEFENEFGEYNGVKNCIGVGSGTEAVHYSLRALGIGPGDEVITPSHTFFATIEAIIHSGAHPVMLDIDPDYYNLSPDEVINYIRKNCSKENEYLEDNRTGKILKALLPVHLYGQPADMDSLHEIADDYNLFIAEDSCQAHGAEYRGKKAGNLGDIGAFSFYFSKNLGALGEGGAVTTDNDVLADNVRKLREHGQNDKYHHESIGYNSRLDELQAAVLRCKLKLLDKWNERRREIAGLYSEGLKDLPVEIPREAEWAHHVYHLYVIRTERRNELFKFLRDNGIGCGMHYPVPSHLQKPMRDLGYKEGDLPETERIVNEIISLPIYPHLSDDSAGRVVETIKDFFK